ncbi:ABC-type nitrate/sulfonate/bicarbonate transport system substrate-binding protein [Kaistia defluvii]|uniref:ABC-type nitrate/sulfonate/bicarbonate transport system substrate-binding protein n=2 Tax=Kaistia defluvii TaxID=410841 RepID=A0ABV2R279_9HYPH
MLNARKGGNDAMTARSTMPGPDGVRLAGPAAIRPDQNRIVRVGFIPLLDIAVLVAAEEQGFAAREGLSLQLIRDVSWANIRDRLAFHQFDVAHMLAPMAVASCVGLGSNPSPTLAPFVLGRGGNAITLSVGLYRDMQALAGLGGTEDALTNARALAQVIAARREAGQRPLVFAMTYPFSSHNYEFRYFMAAAGIDPDRDVTMTVVPPPLTADAMAAGAIDGFCVNAPWNMIAVERGVGRVVAVKADIWPAAPEKVLGVRPDWAESQPETLSRLIVALDAAARWCDVPENRPTLAAMLAEPGYVGGSPALIGSLLTDRFLVDPDGTLRDIPNYLTFHREAANFPWISEALWLFSQMARWGQAPLTPQAIERAASAYRPDLYRQALAGSSTPLPLADRKVEGSPVAIEIETTAGPMRLPAAPFLDGRAFEPDRIVDYVAGFPVTHPTSGSGRHDLL